MASRDVGAGAEEVVEVAACDGEAEEVGFGAPDAFDVVAAVAAMVDAAEVFDDDDLDFGREGYQG